MLDFGNLEKVDSIILRPAKNFLIKNIVQFGSVDIRTKKRRDAIQPYSYKTSKYADLNYAGSLSIETSDFLVFEYSSIMKNTRVIEDVYVSYPQMKRLKDGLNSFLDLANNEQEPVYIFDENDNKYYVTETYENYFHKIENMIGGKSLGLIFDTINNESDIDGSINEMSVTMYINKTDYPIFMSFDVFEMVVDFVNNFNLLTSSQQLMNFSYMYEIANIFNRTNRLHIPDYAIDSENLGGFVKRKNIRKLKLPT